MARPGARSSTVSTFARPLSPCLEAPREAVANEVFNVGDTKHNYRVKEMAEIVGEVFPNCKFRSVLRARTTAATGCRSKRSESTFRTFQCRWDARRGAEQLLESFPANRHDCRSLCVPDLYPP